MLHAFQVVEDTIEEHMSGLLSIIAPTYGKWECSPPELAIGDALDTSLALDLDDFADRLVLHRSEFLWSALALIELLTLREEGTWPFEGADVVRTEWRLYMEGGRRHDGRGSGGR